MSTLRERLEKKIESEVAQQNPMINGCLMYKAGAASLIPLVCELAEMLEAKSKRSNYEWSEGGDYFPSDYVNEGKISIASEALQAIEKFVEGEKLKQGDAHE